MTNHEAGISEQLDTAIERLRKTLREYPWHIGRSGRIRATLLEETLEQDEETVCPIAMLSMHASDQPADRNRRRQPCTPAMGRASRRDRTNRGRRAVNEIAAENDSAPPNDRNEFRRYAAALLINDEPKSDAAAELVGLEPETIRLLADAADDAASPLGGQTRASARLRRQRTRSRVRGGVRRTAARGLNGRNNNPILQIREAPHARATRTSWRSAGRRHHDVEHERDNGTVLQRPATTPTPN